MYSGCKKSIGVIIVGHKLLLWNSPNVF